VGGGAEGAPIDLRQPERGVVGGHDDVGVADQADAAPEAVAVDRGDHRHLALVDGGEGGVAASVGADERGVPLGRLHLLDVDAGVEAPSLCRQDHDAYRGIGTQRAHQVGQLEPPGHRQRVDGRVVHHHLGDAFGDRVRNPHRQPI
jgi:hypothetical protein